MGAVVALAVSALGKVSGEGPVVAAVVTGLGFDPGRFATAEANLLEAHELFLATRGAEHDDTRESVQALADFYDAWAQAAPGEGREAQAAKWKGA